MTISETSGECVSLPASRPAMFTGLFQVLSPLFADSTIHLATVIIITCYQRKETEVGGGKIYKYSQSINITSEFLT